MGWKYEVSSYVFVENTDYFEYRTVYNGNNIFKAFLVMRKEKREYGCVKLVWR